MMGLMGQSENTNNNNMINYRYLLSFICLLLCLFPAKSMEQDYRHLETIGLEAGASVITCILQDHKGLIWMGSDKGLFSYDGYTTQPHFTFGQQSNSRIHCGIVADSTLMYLGSDNGLLIYNYRTDTYIDPQMPLPTDIRAMALSERTLWIGSINGLATWNLDTKELKRYDQHTYPGLPHYTIYSILPTADNKLYIGTYDGFCQYLPETDSFRKIDLPTTTRRSNQFINTLFEDTHRQCIWIGTEGDLLQYYPQTGQAKTIPILHDNSVKSLAMDASNRLLIGTDNGLYIYHEDEPVKHLIHDSRNAQSLSNNIVWTVFRDAEQNIWLGTDYQVSLVRHNNAFRYIPISQLTGTGEGNHFYSIYKDRKDYYWFGGTNGLIRVSNLLANNQTSVWYKMGDSKHPLPHNRIRHIYEDRDNHLWIATDGSINLYDDKRQQFRQFNITDSTGMYNSNWAYHIYEDESNHLWIATCLGGVLVVNKKKLLQSGPEPYKAEYSFNTGNGLSGMFVNRIIPDHKGNVWVLLYNNCLDKINIRTKEIVSVPMDELPDSYDLSISIHNKVFTCRYHDAAANRILMGTADGFAIVPADHDINQTSNYPVMATALYVNNKYITPADSISSLNIRYTPDIRLRHDQNQLTFHVSDLPYSVQEKSKFVHRIADIDTDWVTLSPGSNHISYRNLPFGKYQLQVSKLDSEGSPMPRPYTLNIHITPPWYYTWWAKTIYLMLALGLIAWTINFFRVKHRLKAERIEKENLLQQSQAKIDFLTELSHDLETSLNDIKLNVLIQQKLEEEIKAKERLELLSTPKPIEAVSQDEKFLANITRIIEERVDDPDLNVTALCDAAGVNSKQLYRKVKQLTEKTPVEFIKYIRMKKAAMLLEQKTFTVAEVMYKVGYSSHSYFSKCFQAEYGKTPRQYQEEKR
ncbi:helix-turn-helix domain-containing protein [Bacteroides sp. OttesenSCG-928-J23]|nr:helix-turn-helix domain-containing protein [Bacteroides sp. OttesenSCG-928-J23]